MTDTPLTEEGTTCPDCGFVVVTGLCCREGRERREAATPDKPLTEQEVQEIVAVCERGFVLQLPPDTQLTLARDWLRLTKERDGLLRRIEDLEEGNWPWEWVIATRERERWKRAESQLALARAAMRSADAYLADPTGAPLDAIRLARDALAALEKGNA